MKIILEQAEIEEAIRSHVLSHTPFAQNSEVTIDIQPTTDNEYSAVINITHSTSRRAAREDVAQIVRAPRLVPQMENQKTASAAFRKPYLDDHARTIYTRPEEELVVEAAVETTEATEEQPKRRGRPAGAKNKAKTPSEEIADTIADAVAGFNSEEEKELDPIIKAFNKVFQSTGETSQEPQEEPSNDDGYEETADAEIASDEAPVNAETEADEVIEPVSTNPIPKATLNPFNKLVQLAKEREVEAAAPVATAPVVTTSEDEPQPAPSRSLFANLKRVSNS